MYCLHLYLDFHKSVLVAINIQISSATKLQSGFRITLGVKRYKMAFVRCDIRYKRNVMTFGHRVIDRNKLFVFNILDGYFVFIISFFCFKRWQGNSATTYNCFSCGVNCISTYGTNIKF